MGYVEVGEGLTNWDGKKMKTKCVVVREFTKGLVENNSNISIINKFMVIDMVMKITIVLIPTLRMVLDSVLFWVVSYKFVVNLVRPSGLVWIVERLTRD